MGRGMPFAAGAPVDQFRVGHLAFANLDAVDIPDPAFILVAIAEEDGEVAQGPAAVEPVGLPVVLLHAIDKLGDDGWSGCEVHRDGNTMPARWE